MQFTKATKHQAKLRMALIGPAGSGKSYTALKIAEGLGGKIAALDTERGSLSKYAGLFDFDVLELTSFAPQNYIDAIRAAEEAQYGVMVIDSLSHAWAGKDGLLEFVDKTKARGGGNEFSAWRQATPIQNQLVDAILGANLHVLVTMRSKMEYVIEKDPSTGKMVPRKIGLQPVQRDQIEFEFDLVGDMDQEHTLVITKSRIEPLADAVVKKPGPEIGKQLADWLSDGTKAATRTVTVATDGEHVVADPNATASAPANPSAKKAPASRKVKSEENVVAPIITPNTPDPWMVKANAMVKEKGLKMSEIPFLSAKGGPTPIANLFLWARDMEPMAKLSELPAGDYLLEAFTSLVNLLVEQKIREAS